MAKRSTNTLYTNDNLYILSGLNSELVDLIYLDPPFNKNQMFSAPIGSKAAGASFKDMWTWKDVDEYYLDSLADKFPALADYILSVGEAHSKPMMAYLTYMVQRIIEIHRVLKETGTLYLHCDPTSSHYLRIMLDFVFGKNNFRNEVIWHYKKWAAAKNVFVRNHDTIFRYTKSQNYTHNQLYVPRAESTQRRFGNKTIMSGAKDKYGKRVPSVTLDEDSVGVKLNDVWSIPIIAPVARERTDYPTQKPLALLKRIVQASSNEDDLVMDPFCGCATTCVAAQQLKRKWIGIDLGHSVVDILVQRLKDASGRLFRDFVSTEQVPQRTDVQRMQPTESVKLRLYKEQKSKCKACGEDFKIWNLEIDHIIPKSKGGGDYYENYQLLCGSCNRIKGNRPMEYLRTKIATREKERKNKIFFGE